MYFCAYLPQMILFMGIEFAFIYQRTMILKNQHSTSIDMNPYSNAGSFIEISIPWMCYSTVIWMLFSLLPLFNKTGRKKCFGAKCLNPEVRILKT